MHGPRQGQNGADRSITRGWLRFFSSSSFHPRNRIFNWLQTCSFEFRMKCLWNRRNSFSSFVEMLSLYNKSTNRKDYKIRAINATLSAIWKDFLNLDFTNFKKWKLKLDKFYNYSKVQHKVTTNKIITNMIKKNIILTTHWSQLLI